MVQDYLHLHKYLHIAEITEMYLSISLRSFAIALLGVFTPAILLANNYSIYDVFLFYILLSAFGGVAFIIGMWIMHHIGIKHTMLLNIPFLITFFYFIFTIDSGWSIVYIALAEGAAGGLFWAGFHVEFAQLQNLKKSGAQIGFINSLTQSFGVIAPIVGGVVLFLFGVQAIAIFCATLAILSGIPLLLTKDHTLKKIVHPKDLLHDFSLKRAIVFFSEGVREKTATVFWPMYITLAGVGVVALGGIFSIVRVVTIISNTVIGKLSDKIHPHKILKFGTIVHSITMALRGFMHSAGAFLAITSVGGLSYVALNLPLQKMWYTHAKYLGPIYLMRRELYLQVGRITIMTIGLVGYFLSQSYVVSALVVFGCSAVATLCLNYMD